MSVTTVTSSNNKVIDIDEAIEKNLRKQTYKLESTNKLSQYDNKHATCRIIPATQTVMSTEVKPTTTSCREIIKIDDTNIKQNGANFEIKKKTKRKKGSLNEILSQLEAKKRKEEEKSKMKLDTLETEKTEIIIHEPTTRPRVLMDKQTDNQDENGKKIYHTSLYKDELPFKNEQKMTILNSSLIANIQNEVKTRLESNEKRQYLNIYPKQSPTDNSRQSSVIPSYSPTLFEPKHETDFRLKEDYTLQRKKKKLTSTERYSTLSSTQLHRRLVANARERSRVHALSNAFDMLRSAIPSYSSEQKISKLTILHVAINYIKALQQILASDPLHIDENRVFVSHVNECSFMLQTEYGRSKFLPNDKK